MRTFVFVMLLFIAPHGIAQAQAKTAPKQPPTQAVYLTRPLPLSVDTVGANFKGHDIVSIIGDLKHSPLAVPKSEFETTQQYEKRTEALLSLKARQYVFVVNDFFTAAASYDADSGAMNVSVTAPFTTGLFDPNIRMVNEVTEDSTYFSSGIELRSILRGTTQYVAANGYGVKTTVTRSTFDEFGVVLSRDDALFADTDNIGTRRADVGFDMDVPTAKALKPFLRVALVCSVVDPRVYEGHSGKSPTISSPRETKTQQHYLLVRSDELWVYDRRSGHVVGKFTPGDKR